MGLVWPLVPQSRFLTREKYETFRFETLGYGRKMRGREGRVERDPYQRRGEKEVDDTSRVWTEEEARRYPYHEKGEGDGGK
jgi:hypothetical protein